MRGLLVSAEPKTEAGAEAVERKGVGHPDTICDALAEALSRALCREYLTRFGEILHHNVDKALLCAGRSAPRFGGGEILEPIDIYLAGRAAAGAGAETIPIAEIAIETARVWLSSHLHALDAERHVRIHPVLRTGSAELRHIFATRAEAPLANDTSFGVGYAPLSPLERCVLALEQRLNDLPRPEDRLAWGEDIKIMGVRSGEALHLSIACAMIGRHLKGAAHYCEEKDRIAAIAREEACKHGFEASINVNAADRIEQGALYLTVTGTSAESGDDGQVGRGNRVNGLITPGRPMSLEAAAGKNPVTHVGKLYNVAAGDISRAIVEIPGALRARCLLVSQIGAPITQPSLVEVRIETELGAAASDFTGAVEAIVTQKLAALPARIDAFVRGEIALY